MLSGMKTRTEVLTEASEHSTGNRNEVEASRYAGCTSCCAVFGSAEVVSWRDDWVNGDKKQRLKRWTARCPRCDRPTVIGSASGLLEDQAYLPIVHDLTNQEPIGSQPPVAVIREQDKKVG